LQEEEPGRTREVVAGSASSGVDFFGEDDSERNVRKESCNGVFFV